MKISRSALILFGLIGSHALAGGINPPLGFDSTMVLPKGIRSIRLGGFSTEVSDKYDGSGNIVPLAFSFNRAVTFGDLEKSLAATPDNAVTIGGVDSQAKPNDIAGASLGVVNARVTTTVPALAYGVSDRWTVGIGVPILYSNWSTGIGWDSSQGGVQSVIDGFRAQGADYKVRALQARLQNVVEAKISDYGYKPLVGENRTDLGDANLVGRYLLSKTPQWSVMLSPRIVLPTGRTPDPDKVIDIAPGGGTWNFGLNAVAERTLSAKWSTAFSTYYMYQAPTQTARRIPRDSSESISPDKDPSTSEKIGDIMGTAATLKYSPHQLWTVATAFALQYKAPDAFSGGMYSQDRYNLLSTDTEQVMQSVQLGVTFSTIPLYRSKKFEIPFDASVGLTSIIGGRNVNKMDLATLELISFF